MSKLPLRDLKWSRLLTTETPFRSYRVRSEGNGKFAVYYESETGEPATGFTSMFDAMDWAENTHYASEMQPYVKAVPTWIDAGKNLPEDKEKCLVLTECGKVWTGHYGLVAAKPNEWWLHGYTVKQGWHPYTVTHWMPIPEFSKQGE